MGMKQDNILAITKAHAELVATAAHQFIHTRSNPTNHNQLLLYYLGQLLEQRAGISQDEGIAVIVIATQALGLNPPITQEFQA
jgi:hypothetical protein